MPEQVIIFFMHRNWIRIFIGLFVLLILGFSSVWNAAARGPDLPVASTAYDLIVAVNALRASHGLSGYSTNSILMGSAQAQANYMAAIGHWSDYGPGGSLVGQRLLAAGYPLAGDLSGCSAAAFPCGIVSQNVIQGTSSMTVQAAVSAWMGDSQHQIALLSANLNDIGAGVTNGGGYVYYVIVCAASGGSSSRQSGTPSASGNASALQPLIAPAIVSTPDQAGNIYHVVQPGQALWQIAIAYKVKINDIKSLNGLTSDVIYPNQKLLIIRVGTPTPVSPTPKPTLDLSTFTPLPTLEVVTPVATGTATPVPVAPVQNQNGAVVVGGIILVALLAAGLIAWGLRQRPI
jgi:hypothetical protein